jgi:hypothetical protein
MRNRDFHHYREREHHPRVGLGLFFIVLGLALLVATNDLLHFGSVNSYFTWETAMVFVGILLLLNLQFTGGLLLTAGGVWFLLDDIFVVTPEIIRTAYWPSVVILIGFSYLISSFFKKKKQIN